jgi:hypothetical protein
MTRFVSRSLRKLLFLSFVIAISYISRAQLAFNFLEMTTSSSPLVLAEFFLLLEFFKTSVTLEFRQCVTPIEVFPIIY